MRVYLVPFCVFLRWVDQLPIMARNVFKSCIKPSYMIFYVVKHFLSLLRIYQYCRNTIYDWYVRMMHFYTPKITYCYVPGPICGGVFALIAHWSICSPHQE